MSRKINFDLPEQGKVLADVPQPVPQKARPLLGLEHSIRQAAPVGAVSQSLGGISEKVKRAEEIEQKLLKGQVIVELDPAVIDDSFIPDRMKATEEQNAAFRDIIRAHGQNVPILVRPKSQEPERYEVAFGHRRLRAARELGIKIRAVVRALTDEQLVVAQGQENSGRTDLTFIERALFAARLEDRHFSREIIMAALNVDKAALSRLIAIARRVPVEIIEAIGPAPNFGRVRWQELTDLMNEGENRLRSMAFVAAEAFHLMESDKRFESLYSELRRKAARPAPEVWNTDDGKQVAKIARSGSKLSLTFDDRTAPKFGDFVRERLESLYDEYRVSTRG